MNANEKPSRKGRLLLGASLAKAPRDCFWDGLSRQQVPNGISDNASRYGQQEAPKEIYHAAVGWLPAEQQKTSLAGGFLFCFFIRKRTCMIHWSM